MSRLWATVVILGVFVMLFVVALLVLAPLLVSNLAEFLTRVPEYAGKLQRFIIQRGTPIFERLGSNFQPPDLSGSIGDFISKGAAWFGEFAKSLWSGSQSVLNVLSLIVGHARGGVLSAGRLGPYDREGRQLGAAAPSGDGSGTRCRDQRRHLRFYPRAGDGLPHPRHLVRGRAVDDGAEFRLPHRHDRGFSDLYPLRRLSDRARSLGGRRAGAVLAGLGDDLGRAGDLLHGPVRGGQHPLAQAGGGGGRACIPSG